MPKIQGQFKNGEELPDRDYVDGDAGGPGLNQVLAKANAAPHVFATVAEAELAEYSEPETVAIIETAQFYVYDSGSALTRDGVWVLNTGGTGRLVSILLVYAVLTGRAGGQTLIGGTASGNNLTLNSTSNATKGKIYFGANSVYDEVNDRLGVGTTTPDYDFEINKGGNNQLAFNHDTSELIIKGPSNTLAEMPRIQMGFDGDPDYSIGYLNYGHNNIALTFDAYHNGTSWTSSSATGNFALYKTANKLSIGIKSGIAKGSAFGGFNYNIFVFRSDTENFGVGQGAPTARLHAKGSTSDSSAYALKVDDSSDAKNFHVRNDGQVEFRNYTFPIADGNENEILITDGSGSLSFAGIGSLAEFGEMYQNDNTTVDTPTSGMVSDTWYEVANFTQGGLQGMTYSSSALTAKAAGVYKASVSLSGVPTNANDVFEFAISVNDTIVTKSKTKRKFTSTTDAGSVSLQCLSTLAIDDVIKVELRNLGNNNPFTVENANVAIRKIG